MRSLIWCVVFCFAACGGVPTSSMTARPAVSVAGNEEPRYEDSVMTCPAMSPRFGSAEEELALWRSENFEARLIIQRDATDVNGPMHFATAIPHVLRSGKTEEICRALQMVGNYGGSACCLQTIQTRAVMRCYLDDLTAACGDSNLLRRAHSALYDRGCEPGEGWYQL